MAGQLYLCATPIGNLEDITYRVVRILSEVDLIAAEDTRNTIKLLNHFQIKTKMTSYHEFNKVDKAKYLVERMQQGENIALVTDAGTPGISDPGEEIVRQCYEAGILVTSLPGACAAVTALSMSGLSTRRFVFEAFLPADKKERRQVLESLVNETRTIILYEAPHRLVRTLEELFAVLGERELSLCKELTKRHERAYRMRLSEAVSYFKDEAPRGEFVVLIEGKSLTELEEDRQKKWEEISIGEHMEVYLGKGLDKKEAMKEVAKDRGVSKREVYRWLLEGEMRQ